MTSGTQGNLCGLLAHCGRGDEYIIGRHALAVTEITYSPEPAPPAKPAASGEHTLGVTGIVGS